jgi:hypothetical protein
MKEPANINTTTVQPTPTATVYGMPAYADRAAAVGEVHARPHLLLQAPRGILQLSCATRVYVSWLVWFTAPWLQIL